MGTEPGKAETNKSQDTPAMPMAVEVHMELQLTRVKSTDLKMKLGTSKANSMRDNL